MSAEIHAVYRLQDLAAQPVRFAAKGLRQAREEGDFYIPDFLTAEPYRSRSRVYSAANDHAGELRAAQQQLDDVLNLARVLRASVGSEDDSRAMQAETILKIVEQKLGKAHALIDRHDAQHLNLFMAYFDLKESPGGTPGG